MKWLVIVCALLISACATPYQPYSYFGGGGYRDMQLSENGFKVTVEANGYTSNEQATNIALLRSAELTLENGFKYFVVVSSEDYSRDMSYTTPVTTTANVTAFGNAAYGTAQTYGGQTFLVTLPTPSLTIICFKEKPAIGGMVYDASIISQSLRSKYK